jgi:hypothetical protein
MITGYQGFFEPYIYCVLVGGTKNGRQVGLDDKTTLTLTPEECVHSIIWQCLLACALLGGTKN